MMRPFSPGVCFQHERDPNALAMQIIPPSPDEPGLLSLKLAANGCRGCALFQEATRTVFGEGSEQASLMLVGDGPELEDDLEGRPFRGPAGELLDQLLEEVGFPRSRAYLTNAVKHLRFEYHGSQRVRRRPRRDEVHACVPWLEAELEAVRPRVLVLLGAVAARALLGERFQPFEQRGHLLMTPWCEQTLVTIHPLVVLRQADEFQRSAARRDLKQDLHQAVRLASSA